MRPLYTERDRPGDRALAQQLARGLRRRVVLQGPDVVHLRAVAEIRREDLAAGVAPVDRDVGPDAVVGGAEADREGARPTSPRRRTPPGGRSTRRCRAGPAATRTRPTRRHRRDSSVTGTTRERAAPSGPANTSTTETVAPSPARTHVRGKAAAPGSHQCTTSTGASTVSAGGDVDEDGVGHERVVQPHQGVAAALDRAEHVGGPAHLAGRPEGQRRRGAVAGTGTGAGPGRGDGTSAVHQDAGGGRPERAAQRLEQLGARPPRRRRTTRRARERSRPAPARRWASSARPPLSRRAAASTRRPRSRRPDVGGASRDRSGSRRPRR